MSTIVCGDFASISTERHAAPMTRVVLGRVVKKEHAQRILAFLDQGVLAPAQEVHCSLAEQPEYLIRFLRFCQITLLKFTVAARQLGVADPMAQHSVNRLHGGLRDWSAVSNSLDHLP
jgi:hypothetical protein